MFNFYDNWKMYPEYIADYNFEGFVVSQMHEKRKEAKEACAKVVGSELAEAFSRILSTQYNENNCPDSLKIAEELGLEKEHFLAVSDYEKEFRNYLVEEMAESRVRNYECDFC